MIPVKIMKREGAKLPEYQSAGSAGADIYSFVEEEITIKPGKVALIPTGLFMEIPFGYEAQIRPRSGLALKNGITLMNTPGTIDSDYRGELKIIMANFGEQDFVIKNHIRIAQMVFNKVFKGHFLETESLDKSERGEGGFGHTGL